MCGLFQYFIASTTRKVTDGKVSHILKEEYIYIYIHILKNVYVKYGKVNLQNRQW